MKTYETTPTVEAQGQVRLAGLPFAPGTEVEVIISPKASAAGAAPAPDEQAWSDARQRMRELLALTKSFRNSPPDTARGTA